MESSKFQEVLPWNQTDRIRAIDQKKHHITMTRFGIGPVFFIISMSTGVITGLLSHLFTGQFALTCVPYWVLAAVGGVLLAAGVFFYALSLRFFNRGLRKNRLVVDGPYSVVRHPIYAAWILLILPGTVLFFNSWLMLTVPLAAYASFKAYIHREDAYLEKKYGAAYLEYRSKVNELFPECILLRNRANKSKEHKK